MIADTRVQCKGNTAARYRQGVEVEPSRPCRGKAPHGFEFCDKHEPDPEIRAERDARNKAEREAKDREWEESGRRAARAAQEELAALQRVRMIPDGNPNRCQYTGIVQDYSYQWQYSDGPQYTWQQCVVYRDHDSKVEHMHAVYGHHWV